MFRWIGQLLFSSRWFLISLVAAVSIPGMALAVLTQFAVELSKEEQLEVAAIAVRNYIDENPPRLGWRSTGIQILPKKGVVVAVLVPNPTHARVIQERNDRIKFSYMKLACPPQDAWVYDWLGSNDRIYINLHHYGTTLVQAACPKPGRGSFL